MKMPLYCTNDAGDRNYRHGKCQLYLNECVDDIQSQSSGHFVRPFLS